MTYTFRRVDIFQIIDVNVAQENQSLDVIAVIFHELIEERRRFQRSMVVCQQQRKIEKCATEVLLDVNRPAEEMFSFFRVSVVHRQHSQVEVDALVLICMGNFRYQIFDFRVQYLTLPSFCSSFKSLSFEIFLSSGLLSSCRRIAEFNRACS